MLSGKNSSSAKIDFKRIPYFFHNFNSQNKITMNILGEDSDDCPHIGHISHSSSDQGLIAK